MNNIKLFSLLIIFLSNVQLGASAAPHRDATMAHENFANMDPSWLNLATQFSQTTLMEYDVLVQADRFSVKMQNRAGMREGSLHYTIDKLRQHMPLLEAANPALNEIQKQEHLNKITLWGIKGTLVTLLHSEQEKNLVYKKDKTEKEKLSSDS